jgi:DisA bacterial checkpoint controller nucleotide-binding
MDFLGALPTRIERLRQELFDELGLSLVDDALEELAYARYASPHEGVRAAYGAVIWNQDLPAQMNGAPMLPSPSGFLDSRADIQLMRTFADGRSSFLVRGKGVTPAIAIDPGWRGSESALAEYASRADVTVIQRLATGRIRIYLADHVYSEDSGTWLSRPTAATYQQKIAGSIDVRHHEAARSILDLCVHLLSPAGHGATLVWFPNGAVDEDAHLDLSVAITPPNLSATDPSHASAISHALGQIDRAAVLDDAGRLTHLNVALNCAEEHSTLTIAGGTRHNSAAKYSASQEQAVVFVVSADGPVTVLHNGSIIASIHELLPSE